MSEETLLLWIYITLAFLSAAGICNENIGPMSTNTDEYTFYFKPEYSSGGWDQAWQTCNNSNSSLVVIRNNQEQKALVKYFKNHSITSLIWTAGKTATVNKWTWINGKPLGNKTVINEKDQYTAAALSSDFNYKAEAVYHEVYFVCLYNGNMCNGNRNGFIKLKNGCLNRTINKDSTWSDARNVCLQRGGDLPVLDDEDLETLRNQSIFPNTSIPTLWLGLTRISLMWHSNEKNDIKYTNWDDIEYPQSSDTHCVAINATNGRWKALDCTHQQQFICAKRVKRGFGDSSTRTTATEATETPSGSAHPFDSPFFPYILLGIGVALVIFFIIITIVVIRRRRNRFKRTGGADSPTGHVQYRPEATEKEVITKPLGDSTSGVCADIPGSEYAGNTRPGIVYASLDFLNTPHNSNPAPAATTIPLGDVYAEVVATNSNSGQGQPKVGPVGDIYAQVLETPKHKDIPQAYEQLHPMGPIYSNL